MTSYTSIEMFLYRIIYSGFYGKSDWQNWADNMILNNTEVDEWIYNLSLANSREDAMDAVCNGYGLYYLSEKFCFYEVVQGYLYLMYKNGKINRKDFFCFVGDLEDAYGNDCEFFYEMLNIFTDREVQILDKKLKLYADEALRQKKIIETITYKEIVELRNKSADSLYFKTI